MAKDKKLIIGYIIIGLLAVNTLLLGGICFSLGGCCGHKMGAFCPFKKKTAMNQAYCPFHQRNAGYMMGAPQAGTDTPKQ